MGNMGMAENEWHEKSARIVEKRDKKICSVDDLAADVRKRYTSTLGVYEIFEEELSGLVALVNAHSQEREWWTAVNAELLPYQERAVAAEVALAEAEAYAKEGWDWLSEALDALGAKTVFDIKARGETLADMRRAAWAVVEANYATAGEQVAGKTVLWDAIDNLHRALAAAGPAPEEGT